MMARQISTQLLEEKRKTSEIDEEPTVNLFNKLGACMRFHVYSERYNSLKFPVAFGDLVDTNDKATNKMTDDELHDQFGMLAIAGEDTTVSSNI